MRLPRPERARQSTDVTAALKYLRSTHEVWASDAEDYDLCLRSFELSFVGLPRGGAA